MTKTPANRITATHMDVDLDLIAGAIRVAGNPIPAVIATVLRLIVPAMVRVGIRYVGSRIRIVIPEAAVLAAGAFSSQVLDRIIERYGVKE
jgi:hypothetical protein